MSPACRRRIARANATPSQPAGCGSPRAPRRRNSSESAWPDAAPAMERPPTASQQCSERGSASRLTYATSLSSCKFARASAGLRQSATERSVDLAGNFALWCGGRAKRRCQAESMQANLRCFALAAVLAAASAAYTAQADEYPSRPVRLIVPYAAGGGADSVARIVAKRVSETIGQTIVIENRGGAGSIIGTEFVKNASPDGYTLLLG